MPEYAWANPGHQADDQELFCGGREVTDPYIGACGVCGDSILSPKPRNHEIGGQYDRGVITRLEKKLPKISTTGLLIVLSL